MSGADATVQNASETLQGVVIAERESVVNRPSTGAAVGPPAWPAAVLAAACVVAAVGAYLGWSGPGVLWPAVGYAVGAIGAGLLLSLYRSISDSRRGRSFRPNPGLDRAVRWLAGAAVILGILNAVLLATELAK